MSPESELPSEPPDDPEDWSDEQWLAWLRRTDAGESDVPSPPRTTAKWRDRPGATVLGAAMLGLRDAIYGRPRDEIVIVQDVGGDPPDDDRPVVHLDPEHPELSTVVVHPGGGRRKRRRG